MNKLTIAIPTYNRAVSVDNLLSILHSYLEQGLSFDIFVSDNASSDNTRQIIDSWKEKISTLYYYRQDINRGSDYNFYTCFMNFHTPYIWLLGDTRIISFDEMKLLISELDDNYDGYILNCHPLINIQTKIYTDINELMSDHGWHITNMASCIIPKKFVIPNNLKRYFDTYFIHEGNFIEYLSGMEEFKVKFLYNIKVKEINYSNFNKAKTSWSSQSIKIFAYDWYIFIMSLPPKIKLEIKQRILKAHNEKTKILTPTKFIYHLANDDSTFIKEYSLYKHYLRYATNTPLWVYELIVRTRFIWRTIKNIKQLFSRRKY